MSVGLRNSRIEIFRKRYHPGCTLKLYKLNPDGQALTLIEAVTTGFYLCPNTEGFEGAPGFTLTLDINYTVALSATEAGLVYMFDLVNASNVTQRYRTTSEGVPVIDDWRYIYGANAAFGDKRAVS